MRENDTVQLLTVDGKPTSLQLPAAVELEVTDTEPGVKGDTVSNVTKPATLETGAVVAGAAVRQRRRRDPGRHARGALHLTRVTRIVDTTHPPALPAAAGRHHLDGARAGGGRDPRPGRLRRARGDRRRLLRRGRPAGHREPVGADPRRQGALPHDAAADGAARPVPGRLAAAVRRPGAPLHPLRRRERHRDLPAARPAERRREPRVGRGGRARGRRPPVRRAGLLRLDAEPAAGGRQGAPAGRAGRRPRAAARPRRRARPGHLRARDQPAARGRRHAGRPVLPGHRRQRAGDGDRGRAPRRRADRHGRAAGRLHAAPGGGRGAVRGAHRARARARRRCRPRVGGVAIHRRTRHVADAGARRSRPASRCAPPSTGCPWGWSPSWTRGCGCWARADRLDEVLEEFKRCASTAGCRRWPSRWAASWPARPCGTCCRPDAGTRCRDEMRDYLSGVYGNPPQEIAPRGGRPRRAARGRRVRPPTSTRCGPRDWPPARRSCCWWRCSATTQAGCWPSAARPRRPRRGASATASSAASRSASAS